MSEWQDIKTAPESTPILAFVPKAHRGLDSCEVVVVVRLDGELTYWTNGGPNAGDDMHFDQPPTHWMPLPDPPKPTREKE